MAITTTEELEQYLLSKPIPFTNITPLTGGSSNFVWRLTSPNGLTSIIKHAEPYLAGKQEIAFPIDRQDFEARALTTFPSLLPHDDVVRLPVLLYRDNEAHILQLEDVGTRTLKDCYSDADLNIPEIGHRLGSWLASLHTSTTSPEIRENFKHVVAKKLYRWNYNMLSSVLETYGYDPALGDRINATYGSLIETDDVCVCHTDMWPGNILIPDDRTGGLKLVVIDWEVARNGDGMTDVGHFAGEAFLLDRLRGGRGLLKAFLEGYMKAMGILTDKEKARIAAEFGTRVTFWSSFYKWIADVEKKEIVAFGHEVLQKVDAKDWGWFGASDLAVLFTED